MRITDAARSSVYSNRRFALALKIRETARRSVLHRLSLDFTFPLCFIEHRSDNRRRALDFLLRIRIRIRVRSRSSTAPHRTETSENRRRFSRILFSVLLALRPSVSKARKYIEEEREQHRFCVLSSNRSIAHDDLRQILPYPYTRRLLGSFVRLGILRDNGRVSVFLSFVLSIFRNFFPCIVSLFVPSHVCVKISRARARASSALSGSTYSYVVRKGCKRERENSKEIVFFLRISFATDRVCARVHSRDHDRSRGNCR